MFQLACRFVWVLMVSFSLLILPALSANAWATIDVYPPYVILPPGGSVPLTPTGGVPPYSYSSSNLNGFQVNQSGVVSAGT